MGKPTGDRVGTADDAGREGVACAVGAIRPLAHRLAVGHFRGDVEDQLQRTAQDFLIYTPITTPIVYTDVKDSGVLLTIRYLCTPHDRRTTSEVIWEEVLEAFEGHDDIDLAYPTTRFYGGGLE